MNQTNEYVTFINYMMRMGSSLTGQVHIRMVRQSFDYLVEKARKTKA